MTMGSFSSLNLLQLPWLIPFLFCFHFVISLENSLSSSKISYGDHCGSIVPLSTPTALDYAATYIFLGATRSYFSGGERILGKTNSSDQFSVYPGKTLRFRPQNIYKTATSGVYKIQSSLVLRSAGMYSSPRNLTGRQFGSLRFLLEGFWSESSGKLCMVGSASWYSKEGKLIPLAAVLKLTYYASDATIFNSLANGSLESLSLSNHASYFEPISILSFHSIDHYNYMLASKEFSDGCPGGIDDPNYPSLSLRPGDLCSRLRRALDSFMLVYESECKSLDNKNCSPFSGFRPHFMSLDAIQCSEQEQKLRYLIQFPNSSSFGYYRSNFNPNTTLVGEGFWDDKKNRLCLAACRILNATDSLGNVHIGDCSIRLRLRFPAVWNISSRTVVGQIWTNKSADDLDYFGRIMFKGDRNNMENSPEEIKYEYTQIERVKKNCPVKKPVKKNGERYPEGHSYDMRFDMSIEGSGDFSWGYAAPIFVGNQLYQRPVVISSTDEGNSEVGVAVISEVDKNASYKGPLNVSYKIGIQQIYNHKLDAKFSSLNLSSSPDGEVKFSAEGLYDEETGQLCMVGCREVGSFIRQSNFDSVDCEILVNFQFPPVNAKKDSSIKGSIVSTRKKTDPLYFEHFNLSSYAFYSTEAKRSVWRMDLEVLMVLISNTLSCIFVALQIFHVKKHPVVLPFTSIIMLLILTLGHMIPLVLNFEALLFRSHNAQDNELRWGGGWIEVNEVAVRVVTMVAFILQAHLLQLAWTSRSGDGNEKSSWLAERKSLLITSPIYILGAVIALFVNWKKNKHSSAMLSSVPAVPLDEEHSLWGDLRSYAGLVLDGFLFPQIILNIIRNSIESALSHGFYIGTTLVRVLPHAYDIYRAHNYPQHAINGTYIYANPRADFYSAAWDVIIPFLVLLFALIVYLQQRIGGCFLIPTRFKELKAYEMVPVTSSE